MKRLGSAVAVAGIGVALAVPSASAAEVIGQAQAPTQNCGQNAAYVQTVVTGGISYSPSSYGVITSWSHMGDSMVTRTVQLLVLRPDPGAGMEHFIATQKDQVRATPAGQLNTYTGVRIPIEASERLGLYIPNGQPDNFGGCASIVPGGGTINNTAPGEPPLNTSVDYPFGVTGHRLNALALVEPDVDRDVFGDESQDNCIGTAGTVGGCPNTVTLGKATGKGKSVIVEATAPGAGTLKAGSATDRTLATTAAKKKKKRKAASPLTQSSQTLTAKTRQAVTLTLNLTKAGKAKLAQRGKLGVSVKVVYTPIGGTAGSSTTNVSLKGKKPKKRKKG